MPSRSDPFLETDADAVRLARTLARNARFGALATLDPEDDAPLATRVAVATDIRGAPLILVSSLSAHTGALEADARCSLLVGEPGKGDPLAHPRLTIKARARRIERGTPEQERAASRYLARHPKAALYAGFADFHFFRLEPEGGLLNGGFARAYRLKPADLLLDRVPAGFEEAEAAAIGQMNELPGEAIEDWAIRLCGAKSGKWSVTGIDPEGCDLKAAEATCRIFFGQPLKSPLEAQAAIAAMTAEAHGG